MKDMMNAKLFLKSNMPWCAAYYNCSNACKNKPVKALFILPKNECTRKAWIAAISRQEGTLPRNDYLYFDSSILVEEARIKISYFFFKCTLKKTKQKKYSYYSLKPVLIFSTFKDIKGRLQDYLT